MLTDPQHAAELQRESAGGANRALGFAHGFLTLSERAEVFYKASGYWPLAQIGGSEPLLAAKDATADDTQHQCRPLRNALRFGLAVWGW